MANLHTKKAMTPERVKNVGTESGRLLKALTAERAERTAFQKRHEETCAEYVRRHATLQTAKEAVDAEVVKLKAEVATLKSLIKK